ncbi:GNAT family N-acetyltransferase [Aquimarina sp. D1M17]|uniref:GNAT family N-acetyltransferase n=1 Tax=Aquimarina acroporae TaxID=2937283 RepID=UPI0020C0A35E|nr:GNAT family N-acetyltransferase [Aquimarina acroporae]MCK8523490.1 GNAT family N-acetyltransferase [Aquimarina acroporae]
MKTVTIKHAEKHELDWINAKYNEIDFVESNYENEYIVIAKVENENAGLGRLVKIDDNNAELGGIYTFPNFRGLGVAENIVQNLCEKKPFGESNIWCLPFENLLNFYSKFGFKIYNSIKVPEKIIRKLEWCNSESNYGKKVLLLCKKNKANLQQFV